MEMLPITPERKAQLENYAQRHGQDTAAALDEVLADYLEWEQDDYNETVKAVMEGYGRKGRSHTACRGVSRRTAREAWLSALKLPFVPD